MPGSSNEGISISGGGQLFNTGPLAVGRNAHAEAVVSGAARPGFEPQDVEQLRREIDGLVEALDSLRGDISDADEVIESARDAAEAARADHPDRDRVIDRLDRVATGVASLTGLTEAVNVLLGAAGRLL